MVKKSGKPTMEEMIDACSEANNRVSAAQTKPDYTKMPKKVSKAQRKKIMDLMLQLYK